MNKWAKIIALFFLTIFTLTFPAKFKDVPLNHWAYDAVMYVSNLGIISGYPDGTFRGMDYVSRYQLAVAIYRTIEYIRKNVSGSSTVVTSKPEVSPAEIAKLRQDIEEQLKKLNTDFEQHKSYIEGKIDNVTQKLIQLSVDLANSANKYTELKGGLTNIELKLLTQEATIENLYKLLANDKKNIEEINTNIEKLEEYIRSVDNNLNDLKSSIVESNFELSSKIKILENDIKNLVSAQNKLSEKLEALYTTVSTNTDNIAKTRSITLKNEKDISKLEKEISGIKSQIENLDGKLTEKILSTNEKISNIEGNITILEKNLRDLSKKTEYLASQEEIVKLKNEIEKQKSQINTQRWLNILSLLGLLGLGIYVFLAGGVK